MKKAHQDLLLITEDTTLYHVLCELFEREGGFVVHHAETAKQARALCRERFFDAALVDTASVSQEVRELARLLRKSGQVGPILLLLAQTQLTDGSADLGPVVDDYVEKPVRFSVLLLRLRAQLRLYEHSEDKSFAIGPYHFRPALKLLEDKSGRKIKLTEKEAAILKYLYRAGSEAVGRDLLLERVWGYNSAVTTHTLETHIYRLRRKMEKDPAAAKFLLTEPGGYRLKA